MRSYRDYCRPAHPVERTAHLAKPGDVIFTGTGVQRIAEPENVVSMRKRVGR